MISPLFILVVLMLVALAVSEIAVEEGVLVLTDSNFDEAIGKHEKMLVEFYAPWCGHCKSLAPEWAKAAKSLDAAQSAFKLAKVDATEHKKLASKFEIKGFPTIKYFVDGKVSADYSGGRDEKAIVAWANKRSGPPCKEVKDAAELAALQGSNSVVILGLFSDANSAAAKEFNKRANADENNVYAVSYSAEVRDQHPVDSVVVLSDFDSAKVAPIADANDKWIAAHTVPLVQEFSAESSKKIFSSPITKHVLFFTDKSSAHHASTMAAYKEAAASFRGDLLFVNVPSSENRVMDYFGITKDDLPAMYLADMGSESGLKKYAYGNRAVDASTLTQFFRDYFDNKLKPTLKSEAESADDTTGPVTVLKGTTFEKHVINNNKDVLVEFYAPWCGHCKKLAPIYDELGEKYKGSNVVIAKMDATANEIDVAGVNVKGFPTLYFFPGNDKANPVKYEGGREMNDFVKFLDSHATVQDGAAHEEL